MKALIVEDDPKIASKVAQALKASGFVTILASEGEEGWFLGDTEAFDLAILDLGLPHIDGLTILKRWRGNGSEMPVLILTARGSWTERVEGIEAGADDYLPKPFRMEELIARAKALVRRSAGRGSPIQIVGDLSIDSNRMLVSIGGSPVKVSALEYRFLAYLMLHKDRVVSPTELLEHLYGDEDAREANALEAMITRLRRKIGSDRIVNRRGFGYAFRDDEAPL